MDNLTARERDALFELIRHGTEEQAAIAKQRLELHSRTQLARAAIPAIMARNLSHGIGRHALESKV